MGLFLAFIRADGRAECPAPLCRLTLVKQRETFEIKVLDETWPKKCKKEFEKTVDICYFCDII